MTVVVISSHGHPSSHSSQQHCCYKLQPLASSHPQLCAVWISFSMISDRYSHVLCIVVACECGILLLESYVLTACTPGRFAAACLFVVGAGRGGDGRRVMTTFLWEMHKIFPTESRWRGRMRGRLCKIKKIQPIAYLKAKCIRLLELRINFLYVCLILSINP